MSASISKALPRVWCRAYDTLSSLELDRLFVALHASTRPAFHLESLAVPFLFMPLFTSPVGVFECHLSLHLVTFN